MEHQKDIKICKTSNALDIQSRRTSKLQDINHQFFQVTASNFNRHHRLSHGSLPPDYPQNEKWICDQCSKEYTSKARLKIHMDSIHGNGSVNDQIKVNEEQFHCVRCKQDFSEQRYYISHYKRAHKEIPPEFKDSAKFFCDQCPEVFLSATNLKAHLSYKHSLKKTGHKTVQKRKKSFKCPQCEKVYSTNSNLREHILVVHEKKTLFECDQCPRKFGFKRTLDAHIQVVHTKVNCDACGQTMYNSYELRVHKASVHGIIPSNSYQCEHCPKVFRAKANLYSHVANKHM